MNTALAIVGTLSAISLLSSWSISSDGFVSPISILPGGSAGVSLTDVNGDGLTDLHLFPSKSILYNNGPLGLLSTPP